MNFRHHIYRLLQFWLVIAVGLAGSMTLAQTIYGVGDDSGGGGRNRLYSINPSTGAATRVCNTTTFTFGSSAIGVSNLNSGLVYYIERVGAANPRIASFDPTTCSNGTAVNTTLPADILRATSCPDGRFYAMNSATADFYEISPTTGVTQRTLTFTGLPTTGSGDFACDSNGTMYILAVTGGAYRLYSAASAAFQSVPTGSAVAITNIGPLGGGTPNGLAEAPAGLAGCAAAPAPPTAPRTPP